MDTLSSKYKCKRRKIGGIRTGLDLYMIKGYVQNHSGGDLHNLSIRSEDDNGCSWVSGKDSDFVSDGKTLRLKADEALLANCCKRFTASAIVERGCVPKIVVISEELGARLFSECLNA